MWELTDRELQRFGTLLVNLMKKKIKERIYPYGNPEPRGVGNKFATGNLYNSLTATVMPATKDQPAELVITYADYYDSVNLGRKPGKKRVPIEPLLQWIKIRGIKPDIEFERKGISYAINKSRKLKGKKPLPVSVLLDWIEEKNLRQSDAQKSLSLAFAIQKSIFRYGIRPANIYDKAIGQFSNVLDNLPTNLPPDVRAEYELLLNAVDEDINQFLDKKIDVYLTSVRTE